MRATKASRRSSGRLVRASEGRPTIGRSRVRRARPGRSWWGGWLRTPCHRERPQPSAGRHSPHTGRSRDIMTDRQDKLSATQVLDAGLADWRQIFGSLKARFRTGDFRTGLALVAGIGAAAEAAGHHPDIHLTYSHVIVALTSHDVRGISSRDLDLARQISGLAAELGIGSDPNGLTQLELGLDTALGTRLAPFYAALLGSTVADGEPVDPTGQVPTVWWQEPDGDETWALPEQSVRTALALRCVGRPRRGRATPASGFGRRGSPRQRSSGAGILGRRGRRGQPLLHLHTRRPLSGTGPAAPNPTRPRMRTCPSLRVLSPPLLGSFGSRWLARDVLRPPVPRAGEPSVEQAWDVRPGVSARRRAHLSPARGR